MAALQHVLLIITVVSVLVTAVPTVATSATPSVTFEDDSLVEHAGDIVEVNMSLPAGENASLTISGPKFSQTLLVRDGGDGRVHLVFNTYNGSWVTTGSTDTVTVTAGADVDSPLDAGQYRLTVQGTETTAELTLRDPGLKRIGAFVGNGTYQSVADIERAKAQGTLSMVPAPTSNSTVVVQIDATGLSGAIASAAGDTLTDRFQSFFSRESATFRFEQTNPGSSVKPKQLQFGPGVRVLASEDTYYVVVDLANARFPREYGTTRFVEGDKFITAVSLAATSPVTGDTGEFVFAHVGYGGVDVSTAPDGRVHLIAAPNQTISGTSALGAGWNVTVVVRGQNDPATARNESFLRKRVVRLQQPQSPDQFPSSTFSAVFNLSDVASGTNVTVDVRRQGQSLLERPLSGSVVRISASVRATLPTNSSNFTTIPTNVTLSSGGFVVLHRDGPRGPVVGVSDYLPAGDHSELVYVSEPLSESATIVAVVHHDANFNQWFDGPRTDPPFEQAVDSTTPTSATSSPTGSDSPTPTSMTPTSTSTTVPGFGATLGVVAVLVALSRYL